MSRVKQDGMILANPDGNCILVRADGDELPVIVKRAAEWAAEEGYVLTDPSSVRLEWLRAIPWPPREHSHDGWDCDIRRGVFYMPSRASRGAFRGVLADITYREREHA